MAGNDAATIVERAVEAGAQAVKTVSILIGPILTDRRDAERPMFPRVLQKK